MNVLMFVPGGVGLETSSAVIPAVLALIGRISQRNHVSVIALAQQPEPSEYELRGARVYNLGLSAAPLGLSLVSRLLQLRSIRSRQVRPWDIVHSIWFGQTSTLAIIMARWLGVPIIASLGGGELASIRDIGYGGQLRYRGKLHSKLALRAAHRITAGSRFALSPVLSNRPDALWIPLFPAVGSFAGVAAESVPGEPRLLTVSSVNRVKNPATLLSAFRLVMDRVPRASLDWVGEDVLSGEARQLAASLGVADRVRFHGFVAHENLATFYAGSRLYVQASRHESQGVAVCEAAAAGLPLVGTDVGILSELAPAAAVTVPVGNPAALAEAIVRVLESPGLSAELSENAQRWARNYTADWTAERFEALYAELAGQSLRVERHLIKMGSLPTKCNANNC